MSVNYTPLLQLAQPVNGTESGTWGDDVNNGISSYLDIAVAGGLPITITTTDVTLAPTQGNNLGTNFSSTTSQYAILNVSGAMTAARNLIVPSSSKWYIINNATTGGFALTVKGAATTGITLVNNEKAIVAWNGTDFIKVANQSGAGVFTSLNISGVFRSTSTTITGSAGGTITPTSDTTNQYTITALGAAATFAIPSGTPIDGQKLTIRIKDNGTARALTWTTSAGGYRVIGTTLPITTAAFSVIYVGCVYNSQDSYWDVVAIAIQT
jgi:hypothetical protein